jgi:non-heme chloroperoxidase
MTNCAGAALLAIALSRPSAKQLWRADLADHYGIVIGSLTKKPAVIGHSFGGLLTQIVAGRGLSAVSVAIDAAPFRGVQPLPISALRVAAPVLGNPANRHRAVPAHL